MSRYSRQARFQPIGDKGQIQLQNKHVLIIGVGALGATVADLLTRAGVGTLSLIDRDFVDLSNLQRQTLYNEHDVKRRLPKASAAKERLQSINSNTTFYVYNEEATVTRLEQLAKQQTIDLMIDGTDNFDIRFIINDIAHKYHIPWIYGACVGASSLSFFITPTVSACLHCIMRHLPRSGPTCDTAGIIAPASQITAALQVTEALKYLTNNQQALRGTVWSFDLWQNTQSTIDVSTLKYAACPTCGTNPSYPYLQPDATTRFASLCGRDTVQIRPTYHHRDLRLLHEQLPTKKITHYNDFLLSFQHKNYTLTAFKDGRVFIHGTADIMIAKKIYHHYFT